MSAAALNVATQGIWVRASEQVGWRWSAAHAGFINENEKKASTPGGSWSDYRVAADAEDACFISGITTIEEATALADGTELELEADPGSNDPHCVHEWNMSAGEADENNISGEGQQVILCVKCGACGDV